MEGEGGSKSDSPGVNSSGFQTQTGSLTRGSLIPNLTRQAASLNARSVGSRPIRVEGRLAAGLAESAVGEFLSTAAAQTAGLFLDRCADSWTLHLVAQSAIVYGDRMNC